MVMTQNARPFHSRVGGHSQKRGNIANERSGALAVLYGLGKRLALAMRC